MFVSLALTALLIEAAVGYPPRLYAVIGHPVGWIGWLIAWIERRLNRAGPVTRRIRGVATLLIVLSLTGITSAALGAGTGLAQFPLDLALAAALASTLLAQRSLYAHVAAVADALDSGNLDAGRNAVAQIVGRDPTTLDTAGVCRAAIESLAENFSDGVVAPLFWLLVAGLPGAALYKAVNTADSMIGHKSERYLAFGWAAARLDDLVNLVPARLSGLLIAIVSPVANGSIATSFRVMMRDAAQHRSPNAGWPESAMAGALGIALAGPRRYAEGLVNDPFLNAGERAAATPDDIGRALDLFAAACLLLAAVYAALALLL